MSSPLILIVGEDAVAERVCAELVESGASVRVVSALGAAQIERFRRTGADLTIGDPNTNEVLHEAGVGNASTIVTLSDNDELNLAVALRARVINPSVRVILRQFSPKIGRKIEQNLHDATVMSLAVHAAATYAGAALDDGCFFALPFPGTSGALVGFSRTRAEALGVAGLTVAAAEERLAVHIISIGDEGEPPPEAVIRPHDEVVTFGEIVERRAPRMPPPRKPGSGEAPLQPMLAKLWQRFIALSPIGRYVIGAAVVFFVLGLVFFHAVVQQSWGSAAIDMAETMTDSGFGDASVARRGIFVTLSTIGFMVGGTIFTAIFIGYVSAAITRAQFIAVQGLRRVRARDHIVVCGGGRIGGAVVARLVHSGKRVIVIESHPDPGLVRLARAGAIDLLTGDATNEDVLDLCNVPHARAIVALTNNDTGNLEIALGARALCPDVPLVVRMESRTFSQATAELFAIATFSPAELSAPAIAGLARFPGTLGRVSYGGFEHTLVQRTLGNDVADLAAAEPLCVWRDGRLIVARYLGGLRDGDTVLYSMIRRTTTPTPEPPALDLSA